MLLETIIGDLKIFSQIIIPGKVIQFLTGYYTKMNKNIIIFKKYGFRAKPF